MLGALMSKTWPWPAESVHKNTNTLGIEIKSGMEDVVSGREFLKGRERVLHLLSDASTCR